MDCFSSTLVSSPDTPFSSRNRVSSSRCMPPALLLDVWPPPLLGVDDLFVFFSLWFQVMLRPNERAEEGGTLFGAAEAEEEEGEEEWS